MEETEIPETLIKETEYSKDVEALMANAILEERETSGLAANETEKQKELEKWKENVAKAENLKSDMLLLKLAADEKRRNHQDKLRELKDRENKIVMEITRAQEDYKRTLSGMNEQNDLLRREIQALKTKCVAFELHSKISRRNLQVSNIPNLNIPEEWMRDKLELHFCKTKLGGGVQKVTYDSWSQMALITFAEPLAANDIAWFGPCSFHTSGWTLSFMISPITQSHLEHFQIFSGISRRTILLTGIKVEGEDEESVEDMIVIHFQKASNGGGEVENIKYASKGAKIAYFENYTDDAI